MRLLLSLVSLMMVSFGAELVQAEEQKDFRKFAVTKEENAGPDFLVQGEYLGSVSTTYSQTHQAQFGLQVMALGFGQFDALLYSGGLPGGGWDRQDPIKLSGRKTGAVATLTGPHVSIQVVPNAYAQVTWDGYAATGYLQKVKRYSQYLNAPPMEGALRLFDGTNTDQLVEASMTKEGLLKEGTQTVKEFGDFYLHLEFKLPFMPYAREQARSNSGAYLQTRYEVQILDSFARIPEFNYCGSLYRQRIPDLNMCLPPLSWQSYDIRFFQPEFDTAGNKIQNASITVWHNGVKIHDGVEITSKTGAGKPEAPFPLPIKFQNHRDPVRFRNIWIVEYNKALPDPIVLNSPVVKTTK